MVTGRLRLSLQTVQEWAARLFVLVLVAGLPVGIGLAARARDGAITVRASMPESGGWQPGHLTARVGEPLRLRLTSDDVVHGFAVGRHDSGEFEVKPGQVTEVVLNFDEPGTYTYTCTRWCGPNHWRMRGTIEVSGEAHEGAPAPAAPPLYVELGLDIDAPHPAPVVPPRPPSAGSGEELDINYPQALLTEATYMRQSPVAVWLALRSLPELSHLDDGALWDAVAYVWRQNTTAEALALGEALYSQNCAACHGESGGGDGVFAQAGPEGTGGMRGHEVEAATAFTDPALLAASNTLLQGKMIRGGMGTGMPSWGAIFDDAELQALLDYLWTFQFPGEEG
jgi:mono/diheme cytochrome c family protein/plastocyanin